MRKSPIKFNIPESVALIVIAERKDYARRKYDMNFVAKNSLFYRTAVTKNDIILTASKEIWGDNITFCETAIADIGDRVGWINSKLGTIIGEAAYNRRKRKLIRLIAIRMNLMYTT